MNILKIENIKEELVSHIGDEAIIECNLGRNKIANYDVTIKALYNHIFLVEENHKHSVKSFSYSDIIMKTISISYKKLLFKE